MKQDLNNVNQDLNNVNNVNWELGLDMSYVYALLESESVKI